MEYRIRTYDVPPAVGDGVTSDTAAINAAFQRLREEIDTGQVPQGVAPVLRFQPGVYLIDGDGINATGLYAMNLLLDFNGAILLGKCPGRAVLDLLGSRWFKVKDLNIWGDAATPPAVGVQFGRILDNISAGDADFVNAHIHGTFTTTCMYNHAAEGMMYTHPRLYNSHNDPFSYCLIMDSGNYWNLSSAFVTQSIAIGDDQSFNEQIFLVPDFRKEVGGSPVILCGNGMSNHRYISAYAASVDAPGFKTHQMVRAENMELDVHLETTGATKILEVDNVNVPGNINIYGLRLREQSPNANTALVDVSGVGKTLVLSNIDFSIGDHISTMPPLFGNSAGDPNKIQVTGEIRYSSQKTLDMSHARFNGDLFIREGTLLSLGAGATRVVRTPNSSSNYAMEYNGDHNFEGRVRIKTLDSSVLPSGTSQAAAGAGPGEVWVDTVNNVLAVGV